MFQIVISKLRSRTALDHDRRHFKAAKALVIVIPLLGVTYLLTFIGPSKESNPLGYTVFQAVRVVLLSTQGAVITLPYCYLNTEVQNVLRTRFNRWKMVRNIDYGSRSTRASVTTATIYCTQVCFKVDLLMSRNKTLSYLDVNSHYVYFLFQTGENTPKHHLMTTNLDSKLLNIPPPLSYSDSRNSSRSVSFSEICQSQENEKQ